MKIIDFVFVTQKILNLIWLLNIDDDFSSIQVKDQVKVLDI